MVEICALAAPGNPEAVADCPDTHRIRITLEEKGLPYQLNLIDFDNKPQWFIDENPSDEVPVMKDPEGNWVSDPDVIVGMIEEQYPEPSLETPEEFAEVGSNIFEKFSAFLESQDSDDGTEQDLLDELNALDEHLGENGPYIAGENVTAADIKLIALMHQQIVVLDHAKDWDIPDDLTHVRKFLELMYKRHSFCITLPEKEYTIAAYEAARDN